MADPNPKRPVRFDDNTNVAQPARFFLDKEWVLGIVLALAVLFAYQQVWHAGYIWDDEAYITNSAPLRSLHGLWQIWFVPGATEQYYPLTNTTFWLEYHLWKLDPLGYHLDNVLLHLGNALLLWLILRKLEVSGAWLAAALFALHPVCVESVAWITERKNTLSGFFYLSSLVVALKVWNLEKTARKKTEQEIATRPETLYWVAFLLYVAALLSKTAVVPLPLVILLLIWWKRHKLEFRDLESLVPYFVVGFAMGVMTLWVEKHYVNTAGAFPEVPLPDRAIIIGKALWFYFGKLILPYPLIFIYPKWPIDTSQPLMYLPSLAMIVGLSFLWYERNTRWRPVFLAMAYFAIMLFPACGTFNQYFFRYSFVADHLQYLACIGPLTLAAAGITSALGYFEKRFLKPAIIGLLLTTLGYLTWQQSGMYSDIESLWLTTLAHNPDCSIAQNDLGVAYARNGKVDEAIAQFRKILTVTPDAPGTHNNLGIALAAKGRVNESIFEFQEAVRLKPDYKEAQNNLTKMQAIARQRETLRQ